MTEDQAILQTLGIIFIAVLLLRLVILVSLDWWEDHQISKAIREDSKIRKQRQDAIDDKNTAYNAYLEREWGDDRD